MNLLRLYAADENKSMKPYGQVIPVESGLLVPDHFLKDLQKGRQLMTTGVSGGYVYWKPVMAENKIPIQNDLVLLPFQTMDSTYAKAYTSTRKIQLATEDEFRDADHFVWYGYYGDEENKITRLQIMKEAVHKEDWNGSKPRLRIETIFGTAGCCGAGLFASLDPGETNLKLVGVHVEGMSKEGKPPVWCVPVLKHMVPVGNASAIMEAFRNCPGSQ
jgi:hypothetical protein